MTEVKETIDGLLEQAQDAATYDVQVDVVVSALEAMPSDERNPVLWYFAKQGIRAMLHYHVKAARKEAMTSEAPARTAEVVPVPAAKSNARPPRPAVTKATKRLLSGVLVARFEVNGVLKRLGDLTRPELLQLADNAESQARGLNAKGAWFRSISRHLNDDETKVSDRVTLEQVEALRTESGLAA